MITYDFLQHYWWFLIAVLAGLLVALMFVQGANSLLFSVTIDEREKRLLVNSTGRKWEFTFTTLVTFGGAFFAAFPLFYSTSFGGAYWVWMLLLFTFILQAVSYQYQSKLGNIFGKSIYRIFLLINGVLAPFLVGAAVASFFEGSDFNVDYANIFLKNSSPVISSWGSSWHGLELLLNPWIWCFGGAVFFLSRLLGSLYLINNINELELVGRIRGQILRDFMPFIVLFLTYLVHLFLADGYAVNPISQEIFMEPNKYFYNFVGHPYIIILFVLGVIGVLYGVIRSVISNTFNKGIWYVGIGTIFTVIALFLLCGYNNTAYYPSHIHLQSSLTISNSSSSEFTLRTMAWVSLLIPFVFAYIFYAWRAIDRRSLTHKELDDSSHKY